MPMPSTTTAIAAAVQWVCAVLRPATHVPIVTIPAPIAGATATGTAAAAVRTTADAAIHTAAVQAAVLAVATVHGEVPAAPAPAVAVTVHPAVAVTAHPVAEDSVPQAAASVEVAEAVASVAVVDVKCDSLCQVIKINITLR